MADTVMARLIDVPSIMVPGLLDLVLITDSQVSDLARALINTGAALFPSSLASRIAKRTPDLDEDSIKSIIRTLIGLHNFRNSLGLGIEEFAEGIAHSVQQTQGKSINKEKRLLLKTRLAQLLDSETLHITARASEVYIQNERSLCAARVVTDVRPVFREDKEITPLAMMIVHTLKISYHEGDDIRDFYVTLDTADVEKLRNVLERADKKTDSLETMLANASIPYLDVESN